MVEKAKNEEVNNGMNNMKLGNQTRLIFTYYDKIVHYVQYCCKYCRSNCYQLAMITMRHVMMERMY